MKTQDNKIVKRIMIAFVIALVACVSIPFGFGMYSGIKLHNGITGNIKKVLEQHCKCEEVRFSLSAQGIQFSKEDGLTNQKASYVLKNCDFQGSAKEEATRINKNLKSTVIGYESLDLIELSFKFGETTEIVKIKDGNIL